MAETNIEVEAQTVETVSQAHGEEAAEAAAVAVGEKLRELGYEMIGEPVAVLSQG